MAISKCNISLLCVWNLFADIWFINAVMVGIKSVKQMIYRRVWSFVRIQHYHWINGQVYTFVTKSQRVDFVICWRSIFILSQTFYNNLEKSFSTKNEDFCFIAYTRLYTLCAIPCHARNEHLSNLVGITFFKTKSLKDTTI